MALSTINILQIGDVHWPDHIKEQSIGDIKDTAFPITLSDRVSVDPLQTVVRKIQTLQRQMNIDGICIQGDLTSRGDKEKFVECFNYVNDMILLPFSENNNGVPIILTPGNHDINRNDIDPENLATKFEHIHDVCAGTKVSLPGVESPSNSLAHNGEVSVPIFGINTCLGCGEFRSVPEEVRSKFKASIDDKIQRATDEDNTTTILSNIYEQLDTPAVDANAIQQILGALKNDNNSIFVAGHHNIMPQTLPRVAPYTELLNGGYLRTSLLKTNIPVIYLHGHIHEGKCEVISTPDMANGVLIAISAPLLSDGFNIVTIHYLSDGTPAGCQITPYRLDSTGVLGEGKRIEVPFDVGDVLDSARKGDIMTTVYQRREAYWDEIVGACGETSDNLNGLENDLLELHWARKIRIHNLERDRSKWIVSGAR